MAKAKTEGGAILAALRNEIAFWARRDRRGLTGAHTKRGHFMLAHSIAKQALKAHRDETRAARKAAK